MRIPAAVAAVVLLATFLVALAAGEDERRTKDGKLIVTRSTDSLAPRNAPAHWLPPEPWVYNHWLPFDETRLYSLLRITRQDLWQQLRDDRRNLAELAARRGWPDAGRLAAALVEPERARVGPVAADRLVERARRIITQGHLAQHVFFHSLHQFAIPSAAPEIFGVTDYAFRELRRSEVSPLTIAKRHGRSPGRVEALAIAVLVDRVKAGVRGGEMTAAQGRRLLRRQRTQLPRWLDQARYNGPPQTTRGALVALPKDYASNPAISADGRHVVYESYRQRLPLAVRFGEIAVLRADLRTGRSTLISGLGDGKPSSMYNPAVSGDGRRVAYETSAGNQNFAKRYGRISVLLTDARKGRTTPLSGARREGAADSISDYNPVLAANGRRAAFQAIRDGRTVIVVRDLPSGRERVAARGARVGGARFSDLFEPGLSADGTKLVFTRASGRAGDARSATSDVRVRDIDTGRTTVVSRGTRGFASDGAISPDGRWVAFTTEGDGAGDARLVLHDLATGRARTVPTAGSSVFDPVVARGGRTVAYTAVDGRRTGVHAWSRESGASTLVSGGASDPSISDDGRRVAFAAGKADGTRAVFVRDLRRATTRAVSDTAAAYPRAALAAALAKAKADGPPAAARAAAPERPQLEPREVAITDNAFFAGADRPTVRVAAGETVTWAWQSRQSHGVAVRSGPERFRASPRRRSRFTHRFRTPGTYALVCRLHAPGMRMTVVVE